jgi:hypothetical protein
MMQASDVAKSLPSMSLPSMPSTDEILRAIGLQRSHPTGDVLGSVAVFGAGMLVGAGLALLFAPSSGAEVREQLGSRLEDVRERVTQAGQGSGSGSQQSSGKSGPRAANGG